jgi:hypothetical protein
MDGHAYLRYLVVIVPIVAASICPTAGVAQGVELLNQQAAYANPAASGALRGPYGAGEIEPVGSAGTLGAPVAAGGGSAGAEAPPFDPNSAPGAAGPDTPGGPKSPFLPADGPYGTPMPPVPPPEYPQNSTQLAMNLSFGGAVMHSPYAYPYAYPYTYSYAYAYPVYRPQWRYRAVFPHRHVFYGYYGGYPYYYRSRVRYRPHRHHGVSASFSFRIGRR